MLSSQNHGREDHVNSWTCQPRLCERHPYIKSEPLVKTKKSETMVVANPTDQEIREILSRNKVVAVIGMSKNPEKDAYRIPQYLKTEGYRVIPVNPSTDEILGERAYKRLGDILEQVDIVNVFRPSEDVPNYVEEVIAKQPKVFWLQLGIENPKAEERVQSAGIKVVFNKCIMQEHRRLL